MKEKIKSLLMLVSLVTAFLVSVPVALADSPTSVTSQVGITFIEGGEEPGEPGDNQPPIGGDNQNPGSDYPGGGTSSGNGSGGYAGKLPQTNEKRNQLLMIIGIVLVLGLMIIFVIKKKKEKNEQDK